MGWEAAGGAARHGAGWRDNGRGAKTKSGKLSEETRRQQFVGHAAGCCRRRRDAAPPAAALLARVRKERRARGADRFCLLWFSTMYRLVKNTTNCNAFTGQPACRWDASTASAGSALSGVAIFSLSVAVFFFGGR